MRVAIVGCGAIGKKRMKALAPHHLVAVADKDRRRAAALTAGIPGCRVEADWHPVVAAKDVDAVVVATTNDALATVTQAAVEHGKHVLVEKPAARNTAELAGVAAEAGAAGICVKVGFNHRFHPAFVRARTLIDAGELGPLMYIRARYGHGGRLGYDREWRANPAIAGGGELLDQGIHLIDLSRWFLGEFIEVRGQLGTFFWDMPVEDNGFVCLTTRDGQVAWLHASCTEWKNTFCFEIFGRHGKLQVDGLGGSYGVERLTFYRMLPQMGPPETTIWEYPGDDVSWRDEFAHFADCIAQKRTPSGSLEDSSAALAIVEEVYKQSTHKHCRSVADRELRIAI